MKTIIICIFLAMGFDLTLQLVTGISTFDYVFAYVAAFVGWTAALMLEKLSR